jgi:tyrosinase
LQGYDQQSQLRYIGAREKYYQCLTAPNYTVFSNTTSAAKHNDDNIADAFDASGNAINNEKPVVMSIENPHNAMHLAIGGYDMGVGSDNSGSNGDMGENDTAAFNPIFYFHHCFIDLVFWSWQTIHEKPQRLDVIEYYPGTSPMDEQGPTPGISSGQWLNLDTPLEPFKKASGKALLTSNVSLYSICLCTVADFPGCH